MSTKKELWNVAGMHNPYNVCQVGGGKVFVCYEPQVRGRGGMGPKWTVVGIGFNTDPKAPWYNYGRKTFNGSNNSPSKQEALDWAAQTYGITAWKKDPFGVFQAAEVFDRAEQIAKGVKNT